MIKIFHRPCWASGYTKVIATGATLKEACLKWDSKRTTSDDIYEAFKESAYFITLDEDESDESIEKQNKAYDDFIDSLTGEELFNIMRDGQYNWYVETKGGENE